VDNNDLSQGGNIPVPNSLPLLANKAFSFSNISVAEAYTNNITLTYDGGAPFTANFIPRSRQNLASGGTIMMGTDASVPAALQGKNIEIKFVKNGANYDQIELTEIEVGGTKLAENLS